MERHELIREMHHYRLVAVLRSKTGKDALATAEAVFEGGVKFIEVTFSVPGAPGVIETLTRRRDLYAGAGTVLSDEQARRAIDAGARFVVSPTLERGLIPQCQEAGVPCVSGAATPTEILAAARAGADLVKVFPADCVGGPDFIRQMAGPLPDVRFMVSGGVNADNVQSYARLGVTGICLGSAFLANLLSTGGHDGLVKEARRFVKLVEDSRAAPDV